ncbi:MAG: prepilin-type N-terminal cleavage/methylation domain-containing protein [Oscillospiraceae bacterium]
MFNLRKNKKGFTLVELVVVLVILAILISIMVPGMTKWIDKANDKAVLVEARTYLLAAQTIASEEYAAGNLGKSNAGITDKDSSLINTAAKVTCGSLAEELSGLKNIGATASFTCDENNTVISLSYPKGNKLAVYDGVKGTWEVQPIVIKPSP